MDRVVPQLAPGRMILAEQVRSVYSVTVGSGVLIEDLLVPSFWSLYAAQLQPRDRLEIEPEDGMWYAEYRVRDCARTWAKVEQLSFKSFEQVEANIAGLAEALAAYKVIHRGPHKWSVVRVSDNAVMHEGVQIKDDAEGWLRTHVRNELGAKRAA